MRHTVATDLSLHPIFCHFLVSDASVNSSLCLVKPRKKPDGKNQGRFCFWKLWCWKQLRGLMTGFVFQFMVKGV